MLCHARSLYLSSSLVNTNVYLSQTICGSLNLKGGAWQHVNFTGVREGSFWRLQEGKLSEIQTYMHARPELRICGEVMSQF